MSLITYKEGRNIELDTFIDLYHRSTLGERRPVDDREVMQGMLEHANLVWSAWDEDNLVGLARTLTDFRYVAYLADLAVDLSHQRRGIGQELIKRTRSSLEPTCFITLLAAPDANEYYPKIGFSHNPRAWMLPAVIPPTLGKR